MHHLGGKITYQLDTIQWQLNEEIKKNHSIRYFRLKQMILQQIYTMIHTQIPYIIYWLFSSTFQAHKTFFINEEIGSNIKKCLINWVRKEFMNKFHSLENCCAIHHKIIYASFIQFFVFAHLKKFLTTAY